MRIERTASLLARARAWLRDEHVLAPADSVLRRAVGAARHKARALLTQRMAERLSAPMRDRLDALVAVGDDDPHSPLHGIKTGTSSPSVGGHETASGAAGIDRGDRRAGHRRELGQRELSTDPVPQRPDRVGRRVREMAAPRRHLALLCFLHQAWRDTLGQAVDMYGKLLDRNRKLVDDRLDDMLKAQRHAVDRIVQRYRRLGAVLLDPGVGDDELRTQLLLIVPEEQLREDQSDLANWTRGDRKARFEQTAERHAGLSQFAAPFLSRMRFVDEQGEGASPTLSALRAYRKHRAAGRRGLPPDVSLDFAPPALQPLIRRNGVTDRRRWESALFLKVRDEIQTGNLAIDCPLPVVEDQASDARFDDQVVLWLAGRLVHRNVEVVEDDCALARPRHHGFQTGRPGGRVEMLAARRLSSDAPGATLVFPGPFPAAARGHVDLDLDEWRRLGRRHLLRGAGLRDVEPPCRGTYGDSERDDRG